MPRIIVFDVNETLLDLSALQPLFAEVLGEAAAAREWFSTMLLYSQTMTLANGYSDFSQIAAAALEMAAAVRNKALVAEVKEQILKLMLELPPHADVSAALEKLRARGLLLVALTNSSQGSMEAQLSNAGLSKYFQRMFSVDSVRRFKPAPEVYQMAARELGVRTDALRMVAAHPWDIFGAMQAGCAGAFVARAGKAWFPLAPPPDISGPDLGHVADQIIDRECGPHP